jgi:hypothetical protein
VEARRRLRRSPEAAPKSRASHWAPPGAESVALHGLKVRRARARFGALWAAIRGAYTGRTAEAGPAAPRCWPPVRFAWDAAAQTLRCLDPALWWLHHRRCTFRPPYCRAPLLGEEHWAGVALWRGHRDTRTSSA